MRKRFDQLANSKGGAGSIIIICAVFVFTFVTVSATRRLIGTEQKMDAVVAEPMSPARASGGAEQSVLNLAFADDSSRNAAVHNAAEAPISSLPNKTETHRSGPDSAGILSTPEIAPPTSGQAAPISSVARNDPIKKNADLDEGAQPLPPFGQWLEGLRIEAEARGVSRATFQQATEGLEPELSLPDLVFPGRDRHSAASGQAEFVKSPESYLNERTFRRLLSEGSDKLAEHGKLLAAIEEKYGVSRYIVLAIWGRESSFGEEKFRQSTIRALATQAYAGRRRAQFREELLIALILLERNVVDLAQMRGSWAGAMGQTQFMPSDYDKYAVDQDGDGRPNPWSSLPDALASAANQLARNGWMAKTRWAYEVTASKVLDCTLATPDIVQPIKKWSDLGVTLANGKDWDDEARPLQTSLLMPAGVYGPSFLTTQNFLAIKAYNASELYALFVGHLADRIGGAKRFTKPWAKVTQTGSADVETLQLKLKQLNVYDDKIDGKAGSRTRAAVGAYQKTHGLQQDCWPGASVISHIQKLAER